MQNDVSRMEDHAPGIRPKERMQSKGCCKFCKQYATVWAPETADKNMLNDIATDQCDCDEGAEWRVHVFERNHVIKKIEEYFPEESELKQNVKLSAEAVINGVANRITIVTNDINDNTVTYNILRTKAGTRIKKVTKLEEMV